MNFEEYKELILKNRSYRGFDSSRKISDEEMKNIIDMARLSPSSSNIQPLKFFFSNQNDMNEKILPCLKFGGALPKLHLPFKGTEPTGYIVICLDNSVDSNVNKFMRDVGIVSQSMLLAAVSMGLGGLNIGAFEKQNLIDAIELADNFTPLLVLAIGKPIENIQIDEIENGADTKYYRDDTGTHHVPKRKLEDVMLQNHSV